MDFSVLHGFHLRGNFPNVKTKQKSFNQVVWKQIWIATINIYQKLKKLKRKRNREPKENKFIENTLNGNSTYS